jgi:hypothetical protein
MGKPGAIIIFLTKVGLAWTGLDRPRLWLDLSMLLPAPSFGKVPRGGGGFFTRITRINTNCFLRVKAAGQPQAKARTIQRLVITAGAGERGRLERAHARCYDRSIWQRTEPQGPGISSNANRHYSRRWGGREGNLQRGCSRPRFTICDLRFTRMVELLKVES